MITVRKLVPILVTLLLAAAALAQDDADAVARHENWRMRKYAAAARLKALLASDGRRRRKRRRATWPFLTPRSSTALGELRVLDTSSSAYTRRTRTANKMMARAGA